MTVKIWTSPLSWNCLRTELVLEEKGITDVERIPADLINGAHKTSEFTKKSIFGKVPLLEDAQVAICESRAICRYICLRYPDGGTRLIPDFRDRESHAVWEMRLSLEAIEFDANMGPVIAETLIRPAMGQPRDEAVLARHRPRLDNCLNVLDKALSSMPYMGGDEFSLVDIFYMPCMYIASKRLNIFEGRSNLEKWWKTVSAREAWRAAVRALDEGWAQVDPRWKSFASDRHETEDAEQRAHL